jgi:hypothetical protein
MAFKKFEQKDVLLNTMKAHPQSEFFINNSTIYYNNMPEQSGAFSSQVRNVPPGFISLYEYNIDKKVENSAGDTGYGDNNFIFPFITKGSSGGSFRTAIHSSSDASLNPGDEWTTTAVGDTLYGIYPLSASINRELITAPYTNLTTYNAQYLSLRNRLNFYSARSLHYAVTSSYGNKNSQVLNMIYIPSIFYGSKIKPGSISLKWYFTGSLIGELQDRKQNGELIEVTSSLAAGINNAGLDNTNKVGGVVLYDEGIILLTGSYKLTNDSITAQQDANPTWRVFGAGAQDGQDGGVGTGGTAAAFAKNAFGLSFKGTTETPVMTMFAHAKKGEVNYSNNPSFIKYGQDLLNFTSSHVYEENSERLLANTVSSSYTDYSASFKRQVYVSRVGIYDENKKLIGVATLANPVLKEEDQDLAFKLRLDL